MKGKNISGKDAFDLAIGGLMTGFGGMIFENNYKERKVKNTVTKGGEIDTCFANDTGCFETAIQSKYYNNGKWIVVDEYRTKEEAKKGHQKWVDFLKTKPKKLINIHSNETFIRT